MPRIVGSVLDVMFFSIPLPASAQVPVVEYGAPAELCGVSTIFVDTGMDARQRALIIKDIRSELPGLMIASRPEDAEVHLRFTLRDQVIGQNVVYPSPHPPDRSGTLVSVGVGIPVSGVTRTEGVGTVVRIVGAGRVRVLSSFRDARGNRFERKPSTNFAREFIKAYKKAHG